MPLSRRPADLIRIRYPAARSLLAGRAAVDQMADDFRVLVVTKGSVENEDLLVAGWKQDQINAHGAAARIQALEETVRVDSRSRANARRAAKATQRLIEARA